LAKPSNGNLSFVIPSQTGNPEPVYQTPMPDDEDDPDLADYWAAVFASYIPREPEPEPALSCMDPINPRALIGCDIRTVIDNYFTKVPDPRPEDAAMHLYRLILWYHKDVDLPNIYDGSDIKNKRGLWYQHAIRCERDYFARILRVAPKEVRGMLDLSLRAQQAYYDSFPGNTHVADRKTSSGKTMELAVEHLLRTAGKVPPARLIAQPRNLTGGTHKGNKTRPDLILCGSGSIDERLDVRRVLMLKWSAHHDRVGQFAHEAWSWRAVYPDAKLAIVTSELGEARLHKLLDDVWEDNQKPRYDAIYHVSLDLLDEAHRYNKGHRLKNERLRSLADLLREASNIVA
jgi:hypothetical protein